MHEGGIRGDVPVGINNPDLHGNVPIDVEVGGQALPAFTDDTDAEP